MFKLVDSALVKLKASRIQAYVNSCFVLVIQKRKCKFVFPNLTMNFPQFDQFKINKKSFIHPKQFFLSVPVKNEIITYIC